MKQLLSLFLFLLPCLAWAQYPSNGNQKITLGEQTSADGLIYRGVLGDTALITPSSDTSAYIILDTVNHRFYNYNRATNVWSVAGGGTAVTTFSAGTTGLTPSDATSGAVTLGGTLAVANGGTGSATQNFVDLTTAQSSIGGAKTFTSALTATRFNPTANTATGTGMFLPLANTLGFSIAGTNKMTLDASGNLGLGVTPSAWYSLDAYIALQVGNASLFGRTTTNSELYLSANAFDNASGNPTYITSSNATRYRMINGNHTWFNAPSGTAGGLISFTAAMTLNASGNVGIGQTTPTAVLHLKAGTATASTAPLKFTSQGASLLNPVEGGAVEFNGTNLLFTPSTTRYTVNHGLTGSATLNFPSTTTLLSADLTITVTGAADGDVVSLGVPNAAVNANTSYSAWVSAANTVTVRFNNYSSGTVDPASALFKVFVTK